MKKDMKLSGVQIVVEHYKKVKGIGGSIGSDWDKHYFARFAKTASMILHDLNGDVELACKRIDELAEWMGEDKLPWTLETVLNKLPEIEARFTEKPDLELEEIKADIERAKAYICNVTGIKKYARAKRIYDDFLFFKDRLIVGNFNDYKLNMILNEPENWKHFLECPLDGCKHIVAVDLKTILKDITHGKT